MTGNGEREGLIDLKSFLKTECLKNIGIGQSAAKGPRNWFKVQRLDKVI